MPHGLDKTAGVVAGGMDDLSRIISDAAKSGKKIVGDPKEIADNMMFKNHGSGSFFIDILKKPLTKTKVGRMADKGLTDVQRKLVDLDMKGGKKVHDLLRRNPESRVRKNIANKFLQHHQIKLEDNPTGKANELLEISTAGLTNPASKLKDSVLPLAGAFAIGDSISKANKKEGGDTVKSAYTKQELIEKIAGVIDANKKEVVDKSKSDNPERKELLKHASVMLKAAAEQLRTLERANEKLALENQRLYLENVAKARMDEATKLAEEMNEKGIIKKADIDEKVQQLASMDEGSFDMFKQAIENISSHNAEKDGIDSLTFVVDNNNIINRKTLADSIDEAANEMKSK